MWNIHLTQETPGCYKWTHYFPIYEKHFSSWRNKSLTFLEIGVYHGGSGPLWSKYFGPMATIIGVDIDPACKVHEKNNFLVRIGDQSNLSFLQSVIDEFGVPDIVLDDGSHKQNDVNATFEFLYPKMGKNSIYMVEDLHTAYWQSYQGGINDPNTFLNKSKSYTDQLNHQHAPDQIQKNPLLNDTFSMSFYDSIVVFEKGIPYTKIAKWSGANS